MYDGIPASKYKRGILYVDCSYHTKYSRSSDLLYFDHTSKLTHNTPIHNK